MKDVIKYVLNDDMASAKSSLGELIKSKVHALTEFKRGVVKMLGDDVIVSGKRVGSIANDPKRGIVLTLTDGGEEHEFDGISDMMKFIMDTFRITEFNEGPIEVRGDFVLVNGEKVGKIKTDLNDVNGRMQLFLSGGRRYEFDSMPELYRFIQGEFNIQEEFKNLIIEATPEQKNVVKALRVLSKKLGMQNTRFHSFPGKGNFVQISPADWKENPIPNALREKVVTKLQGAIPQDFSDVNSGNVRKQYITLPVDQWKELLGYYGISVGPVTEGYTIMPGIDRDRYQERDGLEGPFMARNGKVVYYDPIEGKYYDPDSDMYISYDDWEKMDNPRSFEESL
jgi:hypothetical protein